MTNQTPFVLNKLRDFSDVINGVYTFLAQEFKFLFKTIIYYSTLPIVVLGIMNAMIANTSLTQLFAIIQSPIRVGNNDVSQPLDPYMILLLLVTMLVSLLILGLVLEYIKLYQQKGRNNYTVQEVGRNLAMDAWVLLGYSILMLIVAFAGLLAIGLVFGILIGLLSATGGGVLVGIITVVMTLGMVVTMFYIMVPFSFILPIKILEGGSFGTCLRKSFVFTKGNWWITFGLLFVAMIVFYAGSVVFSLPQIIYAGAKGLTMVQNQQSPEMNQIVLSFTSVLAMLGQYWLYPIVYLTIGIQYFSLKEKKENISLIQRIQNISEQQHD
jgi:MFS family permease